MSFLSKMIYNYQYNHCCPSSKSQLNKTERMRIEDRIGITNDFKAGSSINSSLKNYPDLEVVSARMGNRYVCVFDRNIHAEDFDSYSRDNIDLYMDKNTGEAIGAIYRMGG